MITKNIQYKLLGLVFILAIMYSCNTAEQDVSPIISPDGKPKVTITPKFSGNPTEGDIFGYTISFDKPIDRAVTFTPVITGGTAHDHDDYETEPAVLQPWKTEVDLLFTSAQDYNVIEPDENITFDIKILGIAEKYLVHPDTELPSYDVTLARYIDPTLLTINFAWGTSDDIDIVTWSNTATYPMTEWGDGGATGANPEIDHSIWLADPHGEYYVNIMHWGADPFDYTFTLAHPDGTIETITGTFDSNNLTNYTEDSWTAWGGSYPSYRVLKVVNDGTKFVVTKL